MNAVEIVPLDSSVTEAFWPKAGPMIEKALPYAKNRWTLESIRTDLQTGSKWLWIAFQGREAIACFVTCFSSFPAAEVCTILICGGKDVDSWVAMVLKNIENAARENGCSQVEIIGRPGWHRKCPDYDLAGLWLVKELS